MKNFFNTLILSLCASLIGCTKDELKSPDFNVSTEKTEYSVGDSVQFNFSGSADFISFYSGEQGKEYRYKDRTELPGELSLTIKTQVLYGTQANNLSLLYSTDFNGRATVESLKAATWTDISNRFEWSTAAGGAVGDQKVSANVDVSDLPVTGKPIFFAFKYKATGTTPSTSRTWRIYTFDLASTNNGSTSILGTINNTTWTKFDVLNSQNSWTYQSAAPSLYFAPSNGVEDSEDWVVSKAFFPNTVNADVGVGIKTLYQEKKYHRHAFNAPGVYTVTFVGTNANSEGVKDVVRNLEITIK